MSYQRSTGMSVCLKREVQLHHTIEVQGVSYQHRCILHYCEMQVYLTIEINVSYYRGTSVSYH